MMPLTKKESTSEPKDKLFHAVATSKLRLVRLLIEGGVYVDSRNSKGQTPLLVTCSSMGNACHIRGETREKVVKYLISAGADVNAADVTGRTPLIYAVITQASIFVDLLIAGADPWCNDCSRKCAFDYAIQHQDFAQLEKMVELYKKTKSLENSCLFGDTNIVDVRPKLEENFEENNLKEKNEMKNTKTAWKRRKKLLKSRNMKSTPNLRYFRKKSHDSTLDIPKRSSLPRVPVDINSNMTDMMSNVSQEVSEKSVRMCDLCKTVFNDSDHKVSRHQVEREENLKFPPCPGSLFRRRSTGSVFGLRDESYDSIHEKHDLAVTMEDLFSNAKMNHPNGSKCFRKISSSGDLLNISNELLIPDRARSMSLPFNTTMHFGSEEWRHSCVTDLRNMIHCSPTATTIAWSPPGSVASESRVHCGSNKNCDDVMMLPSVTSSPSRSMTSTPDEEYCLHSRIISTHDDSTSTSCDERRDDCQSPIPTIVLTDYIGTTSQSVVNRS